MKAAQELEKKDPVAEVMKGLQALDAVTRETAKGPITAYRNTLADLTGRFVAMCDAGEKKAAAAADLDGVLFWMKERAGVKRENPGEGGEEAPDGVGLGSENARGSLRRRATSARTRSPSVFSPAALQRSWPVLSNRSLVQKER